MIHDTHLRNLDFLGFLVVAHVEEVPRRARHVLRDGGKVNVRNTLLLAELPAKEPLSITIGQGDYKLFHMILMSIKF